MKYNFVIIGVKNYYRYAFHDLYSMPNVKIYCDLFDGIKSKLIRLLIALNYSSGVNRFIKNPIQKILNPYIHPPKFNDSLPLCYIFFGGHEREYLSGFNDYTKNKLNAKRVLFLQDLISIHKEIENPSELKNKFDLVLSYDKGDCRRYGFCYYESPFSALELENREQMEDIDIYFIGKIKNRFEKILKAYNKCKEKNLKVKFILNGELPENIAINEEFYRSEEISYKENLENVMKAKCILEIMQTGAEGFTPRVWEAIFLTKHLLTDNKAIKDSIYYKYPGIHYIDELDNIEEWIMESPEYDEEIKASKNPCGLLKFIEKKLSQN